MKYIISIILMLLMVACTGETTPFHNLPDSGNDTDSDVDTDCSGDGVCDNPPDDQCADEEYLMVYTGEATCIEDECYYAYELEPCPWSCLILDGEDQCGPSPCEDYVCNNPPDPYCSNNLTLTSYEPLGACLLDEFSNPYCSYTEETEACEVDLGCLDHGDGTGECDPGATSEFHNGCFCGANNKVECGPYTVAACEYAGLTCAANSTGAWCE